MKSLSILRSLTAIVHQLMVGGKKMIIYGPEKLEKLLESLFADDDELTPEDIVVLNGPTISYLSPDCCSYSYTGY